MASVPDLLKSLKSGSITSVDLARMEKDGQISKSDRRKVIKLSKKPEKVVTPRMQLRMEVKAKKSLPRLGKDDRRKKYVDSVLDDERNKQTAAYTICLGCRQRGHFLKDCPDVVKNSLDVPEICFNCGSKDHPLRNCPNPRDGKKLPYAKCFICHKNGHISKECPENANGLYPKGGCCHICFQKSHLVRDCPERTEEDKEKYRLLREAEKDRELGPRIRGLVASEEQNLGGDDISDVYADADIEADDEDEGSSRKRKQSSKKNKSTSIKK
jgi:hypothetical protein